MTTSTIAMIIAFVLYLGLMIFVGLRNAKGNSTASDFFLGGRNVGPWVTALSAEASDSSAWLLMGLPGLCYLGGFNETLWTALGLIVGTYLAWLFIAKRLRKCSIQFGDSITIPEFLTNRFNDKTHLLSIVSVIFIVLFFTIYTASGFVACAKLFGSVFGLNWYIGLAIGFVIILSYTILGGYKAVCTTDFIQGALIFIAFVITSVILILSLKGPSNAIDSVKTFMSEALGGNYGENIKNGFTGNSKFSLMSAISAFAWCLGYFGMPHIIVRFMGCRSNKEITTARRVGIIWMIISYIGAILIGTLGTVYLKNKGIILGSGSSVGEIINGLTAGGDSETVFSVTMNNMYPAFIAGIFLCAILAAAMSTADSQLLSASSAIGQDIFKGVIKKDATDKQVMLVSRISVFLIAIIGLVLALNPNSSIFGLVSFAWSGFGGTFGPLILLALYWKRTTAPGAIAGLICGGVVDVVWHYIPATVSPIFGIYEIVPAFVVCLVATIIVSLCTKMDKEIAAKYDVYKLTPDKRTDMSGFTHGVNLGGWLSQCKHTKEHYDTFIVEKDIETISSWGLDHVRLPVDYNLVETDSGKYKEEGFTYITNAIEWCKKYNLNMVLDLHKTAGFSFDAGENESGFFYNEALQERFYKLWEQFTLRYGKYKDMLCFELLNEVTDQTYSKKWNAITKNCIERIRKYSSDIKILVGSYWNNSVEAIKDLDKPYDENIVYNFHCYEPLIFTHQGAAWLSPNMNPDFRFNLGSNFSEYNRKSIEKISPGMAKFEKYDQNATVTPEYFEKIFEEMLKVAKKRNVTLYCGEYGVIDFANPEETLEWYKMITSVLDKYNIGRAAWTYKGMNFGLSDDWCSSVRKELISTL